MKFKIASAAAALMICSVIICDIGADMLYARKKSVSAISEWYLEKLSELNKQFETALTSSASDSGGTFDENTSQNLSEESAEPTLFEETEKDNEESELLSIVELYTERLDIAQEFRSDIRKSGKELAEKLIDYDVALKNLRVMLSRYETRNKNAAALEIQVKTGECDSKTLSAAKEEVNAIYLDIRSLLFDISVMKSEIEAVTGETLKDDFDFDSVYPIIDALTINAAELSDAGAVLSSIYVPDGAEVSDYEAPDINGALASVVQSYYALGRTLREYLISAADVKTGENERRLGKLTESEFTALCERKEDKFLAAVQAKADFSKALLALDESSEWQLTSDHEISAEETEELRKTLTSSKDSTGLWAAFRNAQGTMLYIAAPPSGTYLFDVNDNSVYRYTVTYKNTEIGSALAGEMCLLSEISYEDGENYANVTFYKNEAATGRFKIDIFAPYGGFIG